MKEKKGILLILIGMLLFLPTLVFAETPNIAVEITGDLNAKPGDTITYDIKITSSDDTVVSKYEALLDYDKNVLELKNNESEEWIGNIKDSSITYLHEEGITGTSKVATITFRVKDDVPKQTVIISLKDIKVTTLDEDETQSFVNISDTSSHKVSLSIKSTDNTLKALKVGGIKVENFDSKVLEYELDFSADTDKVEIVATPNNANATFVEGFGNRTIELNYGENEVLIKVQAESGEIQVYQLTIFREDDRNTNNNLKEIIINSGKIDVELSKNKVNYTIKTYKLKKLEIDAVAVDPKASVDIKVPEEIIIGENNVVITVTSENGEDKIYTFTFNNTDKDVDTKLKTLYIKGYEIDFDKNTMVYKVRYDKKYKEGLDINVVLSGEKNLVEYKIYYNGYELTSDTKIKLTPGDKYEIKVSPIGMEEGDESDSTTYTIIIEEDTRINFFFILDIFIGAILIVLLIIQIIKRNKKGKKEQKEVKAKEVSVSHKEVKKEIEKTKVLSDEELKQIDSKKE